MDGDCLQIPEPCPQPFSGLGHGAGVRPEVQVFEDVGFWNVAPSYPDVHTALAAERVCLPLATAIPDHLENVGSSAFFLVDAYLKEHFSKQDVFPS